MVLFVGDVRQRSGLTSLVGWLLAGSLLGAALGYAATAWLASVPLTRTVAVGLGIALGGGVGAVASLLADDASDDGGSAAAGEAMTVDMETDDAPPPKPADLFDDHPDPVLYVAAQGHGPVVLAANAAFPRTFDVPETAMSGTPLAEAITTTDGDEESVEPGPILDAIESDEQVDTVRTAGRRTDRRGSACERSGAVPTATYCTRRWRRSPDGARPALSCRGGV
jgi:hypothetical protein